MEIPNEVKQIHNPINVLNIEIELLDPVARIAAYKAVAHSAMARAFNSIQRSIRNAEEPKEVSALQEDKDMMQTDDEEQTNDKRNEETHAKEISPVHTPFDPKEPPEIQIGRYAALYQAIKETLMTPETHSRWDIPMEPETMLDFMITSQSETNEADLEIVAKTMNATASQVKILMDEEDSNRKAALVRDKSQIIRVFNSYTISENTLTTWDNLSAIDQHQLGIKAIIGINKAKSRRATQILRSKQMNNLSDLTVLQEAAVKLEDWCLLMENKFHAVMAEAMNEGRNLTLVGEM